MACSDVRTACTAPCPLLTRDEWVSRRSVLRPGRSLKCTPLVAASGASGTIARLPRCPTLVSRHGNTAISLSSLYDFALDNSYRSSHKVYITSQTVNWLRGSVTKNIVYIISTALVSSRTLLSL